MQKPAKIARFTKLELFIVAALAGVLFLCGQASAATDPACDSQADLGSAYRSVDRFYEFTHQGRVRSYIVHVPYNYHPGLPTDVVFALHGGFGNACRMQEQSRMNESAENYGRRFIVVYPNGIADRNLYGDDGQHWNNDRVSRLRVNDVAFLEAVLLRLSLVHGLNVNFRRVFAAGMSNGGEMTYLLARDSARFTAVAAVAALMPASFARPGAPALQPVPTLVIAGTADGLMPYGGGPTGSPFNDDTVLSAEETFARLRAAIGNPPTLVDFYGAPYLSRGIKGLTWYHQGAWRMSGRNMKRVELIQIHNGGHCWPSSYAQPFEGTGGWCSTAIDASFEALLFFDNQPNR